MPGESDAAAVPSPVGDVPNAERDPLTDDPCASRPDESPDGGVSAAPAEAAEPHREPAPAPTSPVTEPAQLTTAGTGGGEGAGVAREVAIAVEGGQVRRAVGPTAESRTVEAPLDDPAPGAETDRDPPWPLTLALVVLGAAAVAALLLAAGHVIAL